MWRETTTERSFPSPSSFLTRLGKSLPVRSTRSFQLTLFTSSVALGSLTALKLFVHLQQTTYTMSRPRPPASYSPSSPRARALQISSPLPSPAFAPSPYSSPGLTPSPSPGLETDALNPNPYADARNYPRRPQASSGGGRVPSGGSASGRAGVGLASVRGQRFDEVSILTFRLPLSSLFTSRTLFAVFIWTVSDGAGGYR